MSDRKHMEYCVKLGNPFIQNKLQMLERNEYVEPQINYNENTNSYYTNNDNISFKERLKNWNS